MCRGFDLGGLSRFGYKSLFNTGGAHSHAPHLSIDENSDFFYIWSEFSG